MSIDIMTLIPALIFSDIGPVLSLTGAVGGSCISYIGPGLVYLGVNGEAFLVRLGDWVEHWRRAKGYSTSNGAGTTTNDQDLPVEGNASQGEVEADCRKSYETIISGPEPLWYYLGIFSRLLLHCKQWCNSHGEEN
jgi:hypothetical protein